jgi:hypothetical protein
MLNYLIVLIIALTLFFFIRLLQLFSKKRNEIISGNTTASVRESTRKGGLLVCPICFHRTSKGEKVFAKSMKLPDGKIRVEVSGCNNCLGKNRLCPRCHAPLPASAVVFGLLIKKIPGKTSSQLKDRLHLEGCRQCFGK